MSSLLRRRTSGTVASADELKLLRSIWLGAAHEAQLEPKPDTPWRTWLFLGGRGAGKTRAGAEWLRAQALAGPVRLAMVGPTLHDVGSVMVGGPSGVLALGTRAERPVWRPSLRRLEWPQTGAVAMAFSAEDPESLRGPQFHGAWADEFCAWRKGTEALAQLRLGLRLGREPRLVVTTTPKPTAALRALRAEPGLAESRAGTAMNAANLAPGFVDNLRLVFGDGRMAAQEIDGLVAEAPEGALWTAEGLARCRGIAPERDRLERVAVGLDPPASAHGDACGIVVVGRTRAGEAWVLADETARGLSPLGWARRACEAARRWRADVIVAEANQGGEMVRHTLNQADLPCPVRLVHAGKGKRARAEPVAALYEAGRVRHAGVFGPLEEELMALGAEAGGGGASPDRADALVWAVWSLLLERRAGPRAWVG